MINRRKGFSAAALMQAKNDANGSGSNQLSSIFDWSKRKEGTPAFFSPKEGTNNINIIPYEVKTSLHPGVFSGRMQLGTDDAQDWVYAVDIHPFIGPLKATILCPKQFGKPCPICEANQQAWKNGNKDEASAMRAKKRVYYNVEDMREPGKIKVFDVSSQLFQKELMDEATNFDDNANGGVIDFISPDTGKTVRFRGLKVSNNGMNYMEFKSFKFEDRNPISDALLENAISFDEYARLFSYDDIIEIMNGHVPGTPQIQEQGKPAPQAAPARQYVPPVQQTPVQQPVAQVQTTAASLAAQALEQPTTTQISQGNGTPAQAYAQQAPVQQPVAPAPATVSAPMGFVCPHGFNPEVDIDHKPECDVCKLWDKCVECSS